MKYSEAAWYHTYGERKHTKQTVNRKGVEMTEEIRQGKIGCTFAVYTFERKKERRKEGRKEGERERGREIYT